MLESLRNKNILVVVAHPDDELIGLGGTINKLIRTYKSKVNLVILGEGLTSRLDKRNTNEWQDELKIHRANIFNAKEIIGYNQVSIHDLPDNRFDSVDLLDIIKIVEKEKRKFEPEVIFTHHGGDVNIDHQRTFEAVITACRPTPEERVKTIITFETFSGTEWRANSDPRHFLPNMYVEISEDNLQAKIKGMESYKYEKREFPHPRSPLALKIAAQRTGVIIGKNMAEAFQIVRNIN